MGRDLRRLVRQRGRGQVVIIVAIMMTVLVGFVAVAVDVGYAQAQRRQVQSAADSAAIAAAQDVMDNGSSAEVIAAAQAYGAENASVDTSDVTVNYPPLSGAHAGDNKFIQVSITKDVQRFFTGVVYNGPWKVSATATAGVVGDSSDAALLALNSTSGGIKTAGSSTIKVIGGSITSNYNINVSGSTNIQADEWVNANDGFKTSGSWTIKGGSGTNPAAPEVPDPLAGKISPPTMPSFPTDPVTDVTGTARTCPGQKPGYNAPYTYTGTAGVYNSTTSQCYNLAGNYSGTAFQFPAGNYKFTGGAGVAVTNYPYVSFLAGTYIFNGGSGLNISGSTTDIELYKGNYAFLGGTSLSIGGSVAKTVLGTGATAYNQNYFYFTGGGGISASGSDNVVIYPGTYIFDGGVGLSMSGSSTLTFEPGSYKFYFDKGAGMSFSGSSTISTNASAYVQAWFLGSKTQFSNMAMSGSTSFSLPSGEYYFDYGNFTNSGSSTISGSSVFIYFGDQGALTSSGSAKFGFTAPTTKIYTGYYPGVFMYANANDSSTFTWTGSTSSVSYGAVYLPSAQLVMTGSSSGKVMVGQLIANSFSLSGSNNTTVEYHEYVSTATPKVYLVQ